MVIEEIHGPQTLGRETCRNCQNRRDANILRVVQWSPQPEENQKEQSKGGLPRTPIGTPRIVRKVQDPPGFHWIQA